MDSSILVVHVKSNLLRAGTFKENNVFVGQLKSKVN